MSDPTIEKVDLLGSGYPAEFKLYPGAPGVPVADIGEVASRSLGGDQNDRPVVLGDTNETFTAFFRHPNIKPMLALTFTAMSFSEPPSEAPAMQRTAYGRFHLVIIDPHELRQISLPFSVPQNLVYEHERCMWGVAQGASKWGSDRATIYAAISSMLRPVNEWLGLAYDVPVYSNKA